MTPGVRPKYRNVLCPWQTESELKSQQKTLDKMLARLQLSEEEEARLLLLDRPDWEWKR